VSLLRSFVIVSGRRAKKGRGTERRRLTMLERADAPRGLPSLQSSLVLSLGGLWFGRRRAGPFNLPVASVPTGRQTPVGLRPPFEGWSVSKHPPKFNPEGCGVESTECSGRT